MFDTPTMNELEPIAGSSIEQQEKLTTVDLKQQKCPMEHQYCLQEYNSQEKQHNHPVK